MLSPIEILILILTIAIAYYFIRRSRNAAAENTMPPDAPSEEQEQPKEDVVLGEMIRTASTKTEFVDIALNYYLDGEDSAEFLKRCPEFENELTPDDWVEIYEASEEGTELERVAEERAGDLLLHEEVADR